METYCHVRQGSAVFSFCFRNKEHNDPARSLALDLQIVFLVFDPLFFPALLHMLLIPCSLLCIRGTIRLLYPYLYPSESYRSDVKYFTQWRKRQAADRHLQEQPLEWSRLVCMANFLRHLTFRWLKLTERNLVPGLLFV